MLKSYPHNEKTIFKSSIEFTSAESGFRQELIEKDYYCTLILDFLFENKESPLVFKGGTSLTKVHTGFYRLSEDLDFTVSIKPDGTSSSQRKIRKETIKPIKKFFNSIPKKLPFIEIVEKLQGHDEQRQYNGKLGYESVLTKDQGIILFEVSLREPHLESTQNLKAKTILLNPFSGKNSLPPIEVMCLSTKGAYAEKIRAALSRKRAAIRDLFDVQLAIQQGVINLEDATLIRSFLG